MTTTTTTLTTTTLTTTTLTTTTLTTTMNPDAIIVNGTKPTNTWLYINDIKVLDISFFATEWTYVIEYPTAGVNALKIYVQDNDGNKSEPIIISNVYLQGNMENISFSKDTLIKSDSHNEVELKNVELVEVYGTDPGTGKSVVTDSYLKVT